VLSWYPALFGALEQITMYGKACVAPSLVPSLGGGGKSATRTEDESVDGSHDVSKAGIFRFCRPQPRHDLLHGGYECNQCASVHQFLRASTVGVVFVVTFGFWTPTVTASYVSPVSLSSLYILFKILW
jgi:hypothetical protein